MEKYTKTYQIGRYQCDRNGTLRLRALFNLLQDMADSHADSINIGYHFCIEKNLTWMGSYYHVKINQMPIQEDMITIKTWPIKMQSPLTARREFEIYDVHNNLIITASSQWILVDILKKRPISILPFMADLDLREDMAQTADFKKLPSVETPLKIHQATIREDDIDINQHVNNSVYPSFILDMHTPEFLKEHPIQELKVQFKQGITTNQQIHIKSTKSEEGFLYAITDEQETTDFARMEVIFK